MWGSTGANKSTQQTRARPKGDSTRHHFPLRYSLSLGMALLQWGEDSWETELPEGQSSLSPLVKVPKPQGKDK